MAEDITDVYIATEAGDAGWQSLSALTAEKVEPKLPISSADGTVVLDSPSANTFTIETGGTAQFTVRSDGNIGQGYSGQANINYALYQGFGISTQEEIGFLSAPKFDDQPAVRCVSVESQPLFTDVKASSVVHFNAKDDRAGNKEFTGTQIGFQAGYFTKSSTQNIGFDSAVSGSGNFAFFASGSSPSQFNGGVFTPSVRGLADNDASIALGAELLTSNHTPTQPNSIATKQTVDDKIWVGTTAEYGQISPKNPTTLYCLTD